MSGVVGSFRKCSTSLDMITVCCERTGDEPVMHGVLLRGGASGGDRYFRLRLEGWDTDGVGDNGGAQLGCMG